MDELAGWVDRRLGPGVRTGEPALVRTRTWGCVWTVPSCAALVATGRPACVDHNDLHARNIVGRVDGPRFYDWGDAVLAHPFACLLTTLDTVAPDAGPAVRDACCAPPRARPVRPAAAVAHDPALTVRVGEDGSVETDPQDADPAADGAEGRLASFHLVREPAWRAPVALARLATDRVRLRGTPGLRFARLLGTGSGADATGVDLARSALFAVWESPAALAAFEEGWFAARAARVRARGGEVYALRLALISGHGRWGGRDVLADLTAGPGSGGGPVAVLTRATVRPTRWHRFRGARPPVSAELAAAPGLRAMVAIGEAPVGLQATFSLWSDAPAVSAFARGPRHAAVVARTRREHWYGEELFARFRPVWSSGSWDGRDPISG